MQCGREPGGHNTNELGICPAATDASFDGLNGGKNAGRACWIRVGMLCNGKVQGTFSEKLLDCQRCEFLHFVGQEEDVTAAYLLNQAIDYI